jgi:hypothetical protein
LGDIDAALRRDEWPKSTSEYFDRSSVVFTRSVAFVTDRTPLDPEPGYHSERVDPDSGIIMKRYDLTDGRGYDDTVIFDYISDNWSAFDVLVVVTSDRDYFSVARWLAKRRAQLGAKQIIFVSYRHILRYRPNRSKLEPAHMVWMHDFLPELTPPK